MRTIATTTGARHSHRGYVLSPLGRLGMLRTNSRGNTLPGTFVPVTIEGAWEALSDLEAVARAAITGDVSKGWIGDPELAGEVALGIRKQLTPIGIRYFPGGWPHPDPRRVEEYYTEVADNLLGPVC